MSKAKGFERLKHFESLDSLWCFDIDQKSLENICKCESLENLYIGNLKVSDISCIRELRRLKVFRLERCSKIVSLNQFADLQTLEVLGISGFKNVHAIDPLSKLERLQELEVSGTMWTAMEIDSLVPLSDLHNLVFLDLCNLRARDGSLSPLSGLHMLEGLIVTNRFPMGEYAKLSTHLKNVDCHSLRPYFETGMYCKKCKKNSLVILTGKGTSSLCKNCDAGRLERHVVEFQRIADTVG